jgi:hypothetical protein
VDKLVGEGGKGRGVSPLLNAPVTVENFTVLKNRGEKEEGLAPLLNALQLL